MIKNANNIDATSVVSPKAPDIIDSSILSFTFFIVIAPRQPTTTYSINAMSDEPLSAVV